MEMHDKVLAFVKTKGPVIPMQVAKDLGKDTFYAGALLSELLNHKIIKISSAKIGGTPVYYMPGQEEKLQMLYNGLQQKEKEAYNLIKEKKLLKDRDVEPAIRVALRAIKDFAIPFYSKNQEIMWRWYLHKTEQPRQIEQPATINQQPIQQPQPMKPLQPSVIQTQQPIIQQQKIQVSQQRLEPVAQLVTQQEKQQKKTTTKEASDVFINAIRNYLQTNHIQVTEEKVLKKNKEYEVLAKVPSNVGLLDYVIIAKNKKKIADSDLSLAHNQGQLRKLPVLLLTNGELSKKAIEYKEKNLKGFMLVKSI